MGFEIAGEIFLGAAGLGEDDRLACSAHLRHAGEALIQCIQESMRFLVFPDAAGDGQIILNFGDFGSEEGKIDLVGVVDRFS